MQNNRVILIGTNRQLTREIQESLEGVTASAPPCYSFESIRKQLGPHSSGLMVTLTASAEDAKESISLAREIHQRQWPWTLLAVETETFQSKALPTSDVPPVLFRLRWPSQASTLVKLLEGRGKFSVGARPCSSATEKEKGCSFTEVMRREVLRHTPSLEGLAEAVAVAAAHDVTVLLNGETGTGKTYLARFIHDHSSRKDHPLLVVPCGALSPGLIESELFGHAKGAFTGADRAKVGKFEAAGKGTLLLDEIDTLGLEQQAKLLRVIETGAYEPVGSNTTKTCQARIIAASNWDLEAAMLEGKFRQDLYYRLNVLAFYLPPLRERVRDIAPLACGLAAHYAAKFGKELFAITAEALEALQSFPWPGNIRQLENVVQQAVLVGAGPELQREHLPQRVREFVAPSLASNPTITGHGCSPAALATRPSEPFPAAGAHANDQSLAELRAIQERAVIETALEEANNSPTCAARALGVSRATLYNKMKKYGLARTNRDFMTSAR
jgi:two-component system, NtrC family, response regulator HydG